VLEMQDCDAYNVFFNSDKHSYDISFVFKDGNRWTLDTQTHQSKKLNMILDFEKLLRLEIILSNQANMEAEDLSYKTEIARELIPIEQRGLNELEQCFQNVCKQDILTGDEMLYPCKGCAMKKGSQ
jgi:hypothetical protein